MDSGEEELAESEAAGEGVGELLGSRFFFGAFVGTAAGFFFFGAAPAAPV